MIFFLCTYLSLLFSRSFYLNHIWLHVFWLSFENPNKEFIDNINITWNYVNIAIYLKYIQRPNFLRLYSFIIGITIVIWKFCESLCIFKIMMRQERHICKTMRNMFRSFKCHRPLHCQWEIFFFSLLRVPAQKEKFQRNVLSVTHYIWSLGTKPHQFSRTCVYIRFTCFLLFN